MIDHALACLDQVANWVDEFEAHEALPAESGETARKLAEDLRGLIQVRRRRNRRLTGGRSSSAMKSRTGSPV